MKAGKRRVVAKGDRLNWTPLNELKPAKLVLVEIKGHELTSADLKAKHIQTSKDILVP